MIKEIFVDKEVIKVVYRDRTPEKAPSVAEVETEEEPEHAIDTIER